MLTWVNVSDVTLSVLIWKGLLPTNYR